MRFASFRLRVPLLMYGCPDAVCRRRFVSRRVMVFEHLNRYETPPPTGDVF